MEVHTIVEIYFLAFAKRKKLIFIICVFFLLTEVNSKVVLTFILCFITLTSGFVIRPFENIKFDIPGGDKSLDLEVIGKNINDENLPTTTSTTDSKASTIPHTTTTTVGYDKDDTDDTDESYDEDRDTPSQFLMFTYNHINQ